MDDKLMLLPNLDKMRVEMRAAAAGAPVFGGLRQMLLEWERQLDAHQKSLIPSSPVPIELLDHGYLKFVEHWGCDERVIEAARMSTDKGFLGWGPIQCPNEECLNGSEPRGGALQTCLTCNGHGKIAGDEKLLRYLYTHAHHTPFEMSGITIEVQAPIFVFREWQRHRTQSYNELSARYTPLPDLNYVPSAERLLIKDSKNKQAQGDGDFKLETESDAEIIRVEMAGQYGEADALYRSWLKAGVPKELARVIIPVGRYSRMMASANLRNWLAFLTLRMDKNAQWEIRQYANAVGTIIEQRFPRTWQLFVEGRKP